MDGFDYSSVAWETDNKGANATNPFNLETSNEFEANLDNPTYSDVPFASSSKDTGVKEDVPLNTNDEQANKLRIVPMTVYVTNFQKENEGTSDAHISYLITTHTNLPSFTAPEVSVRRRFMDFVWLYNGLIQDYPACVIPPLPEKHRLEYVTGDRFGEDFIEKRRVALERFLNRLANHPTLQRTSYLKKFLDSPDWSSNSVEKVKGEGMLENLSDSIVNAFSRVKKADEKFINIKENVDKFEENIMGIEKMHQKILKKQLEIQMEYLELNKAVASLGELETGMVTSLNLFAKVNEEFGDEIKRLVKTEDMYYLSHLREYLAYSNAVKGVLKLRDQKQVDFEELTDYLQAQVAELDRIRSTGRAGGLSSFFKEKYEGMKGVDQEQAKQARITKCEEKIKELEEAVSSSHEVSEAFNQEVEKEFEVFQHSKTVDLKEALVNYSKNKVDFFKNSLQIWQNIIPKLEEASKGITTQSTQQNESEDTSTFPDSHLMNPYADAF